MTTIDDQITKLFAKVQTERLALESLEVETKKSWVTNCSINLPETGSVNITTASLASIMNVTIALLKHRDYTAKAHEVLGLEPDNKLGAATYDLWLADCKKRVSVLQLTARKKQLDELEGRLNLIISPEQRRMLELEAITKALG